VRLLAPSPSEEKTMSGYTIKRTFHTGFCVADLDWTVGFFQQVMGFKLIDKAPRDTRNQSFVTGVPDTHVMIAYMDCAGHSLELQAYSGPPDRQEYRPRMVDMGHFHLSFVVDDVEAVVAACLKYDPRIRTLAPGVLVVDKGPNKGNSIQFVVLPDGVHLEFTTRINE
jgi:catechol 2,3-dioxygenase-like lactoylglutathione lyase family enzyme